MSHGTKPTRNEPRRLHIQDAKYSGKKDWDEIPRYRRYREEHDIELMPFEHYEKGPAQPPKRLRKHEI